MITIHTWDELAKALASPLDPVAKQILAAHRNRLAEFIDYDLSELAGFLIVEPGDEMATIEGFSLSVDPEYRTQHPGWTETVFIVSDDGFGWVVLTRT